MTENPHSEHDATTTGTHDGTDYDAGYRAGYQAAQPPYAAPTYRRLTRSRPHSPEGAPISGVSGGLARYLGLDPTLVRVLVAVAMVFTFPAAPIVYVVMWAVVPQE